MIGYTLEQLENHSPKMSVTWNLRTIDCDCHGRLRPDAAFIVMQELAGDHAQALNCGRDNLLKKDIVWVLARSSVAFEKVPALGAKLTAVTWPGPAAHMLFPRNYMFYQDGQPVGAAATLWMLVDAHTHAPVKNAAKEVVFPTVETLDPPLAAPRRIRPQGELTKTLQRRCSYCDLDVNGHMNNTRYLQWVADAIGPVQTPRAYQLNFISEIHPQEQVSMDIYKNTVIGKGQDGRLAFEALMI